MYFTNSCTFYRLKAIKKHTDFFEVNEGTLFSASTHERITDKNISGYRLEIKDTLKPSALKHNFSKNSNQNKNKATKLGVLGQTQ